MAIDEELVGHVREALVGHVREALAQAPHGHEVKMFGGLGFMLNGSMVAAASDRGLLVRVGDAGEARALAFKGAEQMLMNGRRMKGFVQVKGGPRCSFGQSARCARPCVRGDAPTEGERS